MTYSRSKTIALVAVVATLVFVGAPASAGSTSIFDGNIPGPTCNINLGERGTFLAEWWHTNYGFTF